MKVYFSAPVSRVSEETRANYLEIIEGLKMVGHSVLYDHLVTRKTQEVIENQSPKESFEIQKLMTKRKNQADIVVIEASTPSFGIGQEIEYSVRNNKQVIVLYLSGSKPHLLRDEGADLIFMYEYNSSNVKEVVAKAIKEVGHQIDVRFNFYISPEIGRYLDWVSLHKKIPRAAFLRSLIEKNMKQEKEFGNT